ncbi:MAG TPA: hypothetical protein VNZ54_03200, partial [bacterium]|nr:hypothetical protein [bacterium]
MREHPLPLDSIDGLACDGTYLYAASAVDGKVCRVALPAAPGAPLGPAHGGITGLNAPRGLTVSGGALYVAESGAQDVRAFALADLSESPVSHYGAGYLDQGYTYDVSVDPAADELYAPDGTRVVVYQLSTGQYLREFGGAGPVVTGLVKSNGVLYLFEQTTDLLEAVDPAQGAVLGRLQGSGGLEGQFSSPAGLRLDAAGCLMAGDALVPRVQLFQPVVPKPTVSIATPRLALLNGAPMPLVGTVQVDALPAVPSAALAGFTVTLGKPVPPRGQGPAVIGGGTVDVLNNTLAPLDVTGLANGVYQVNLAATDKQGLAYGDQTFLSKGKYRFQAAYHSPELSSGTYALSVENPSNQHLFIALNAGAGPSATQTILELRGDGRWVGQSQVNLPQASQPVGLACDGSSLYLLTDPGSSGGGQLLRYPLPTADGGPLGALADQASGLESPTGLAINQGKVYVAALAALEVYDASNLGTAPTELCLGYLQDGGADGVAVDPSAAELYVGDRERVVVFGLDGSYHRQFNLRLPSTINALAVDNAKGILYVNTQEQAWPSAYDAFSPTAGTFLGATEGPGSGQGQFGYAGGLQFPVQGRYLAVGDQWAQWLQLLEPFVPKGYAQIVSPALTLQNQGPFSVVGTVNVQGLANWSLSWGQSATGNYQTLANGNQPVTAGQ